MLSLNPKVNKQHQKHDLHDFYRVSFHGEVLLDIR